jgi:hypothetical protein
LGNFKLKVCADKDCCNDFKQYNSLQKYCSPACTNKNRKVDLKLKPIYNIPKVSEKRKALIPVYEKVRIEVLTEAKFKCFIDGCNNVANTCEHTMGRVGYADEWARENNITLYVDKRYLKACCLHHNGELENNPELSKKHQLSKIHGGKKT